MSTKLRRNFNGLDKNFVDTCPLKRLFLTHISTYQPRDNLLRDFGPRKKIGGHNPLTMTKIRRYNDSPPYVTEIVETFKL